MIQPLISVITVNYNDGHGLQKTLKSVKGQLSVEFEHLVIDGGSSDNSVEVIASFSNYLSYHVSEKDSGIYHAMNKGINAAKGKYLLFLNSGDYLTNPNSLITFVPAIKNNFDIIYGNLVISSSKGDYVQKYTSVLSFSKLYQKSLPHPATVIKRDVFNTCFKYNEKLKISSDFELFIVAICKMNCTYKYLDANISFHGHDGISSNPSSQSLIIAEKNEIMRTHFPLFSTDLMYIESMKLTHSSLRYIIFDATTNSFIARKLTTLVLKVLRPFLKLNKPSN